LAYYKAKELAASSDGIGQPEKNQRNAWRRPWRFSISSAERNIERGNAKLS